MENIPLIDLKAQVKPIRKQIDKAIKKTRPHNVKEKAVKELAEKIKKARRALLSITLPVGSEPIFYLLLYLTANNPCSG